SGQCFSQLKREFRFNSIASHPPPLVAAVEKGTDALTWATVRFVDRRFGKLIMLREIDGWKKDAQIEREAQLRKMILARYLEIYKASVLLRDLFPSTSP